MKLSAHELFLTCQHGFYSSCRKKKKKSKTKHWVIPLPRGGGLTSIPLEILTWILMKIFKDASICSLSLKFCTQRAVPQNGGRCGGVLSKGSTETILERTVPEELHCRTKKNSNHYNIWLVVFLDAWHEDMKMIWTFHWKAKTFTRQTL